VSEEPVAKVKAGHDMKLRSGKTAKAVSLSVATPLAAPLTSKRTVTTAAKGPSVSVSQSLAASDTHEHATLSKEDVGKIREKIVDAFGRRLDMPLSKLIINVTSKTEYSTAQVMKVIDECEGKLFLAEGQCYLIN
jgi:hypothetical protein